MNDFSPDLQPSFHLDEPTRELLSSIDMRTSRIANFEMYSYSFYVAQTMENRKKWRDHFADNINYFQAKMDLIQTAITQLHDSHQPVLRQLELLEQDCLRVLTEIMQKALDILKKMDEVLEPNEQTDELNLLTEISDEGEEIVFYVVNDNSELNLIKLRMDKNPAYREYRGSVNENDRGRLAVAA